jgi:hypothetical protein
MRKLRWVALGLAVLVGGGGCASGGGEAAATREQRLAVADVRTLAGRWAGLMEMPGSRSRDQYVEVDVQPDGTYRALSARTIGVLDAHGTLAARDGRVVVQGAQGASGQGTLVSRDGNRWLMIDMTRPDGTHVSARLSPQP